MPTLDYARFRVLFPAFADTVKYPDTTLQMFYELAGTFIDSTNSPCRILSGKQLELALEYMTAHLLSLADAQQASAASGDTDQGGFITGATIGEITVEKAAPPTADGWEFWLASTPYGTALWALLELLAVGGLSIGGLPEREGFRKAGGVFW